METIVITTDEQQIKNWAKVIENSGVGITFSFKVDEDFAVGYYECQNEKISLGSRDDFPDFPDFQFRISDVIAECN